MSDDPEPALSEGLPRHIRGKLRPLVALLAQKAAREWVDEQFQAGSEQQVEGITAANHATAYL